MCTNTCLWTKLGTFAAGCSAYDLLHFVIYYLYAIIYPITFEYNSYAFSL